jgi:putative ABC transport system substrate-binding protein
MKRREFITVLGSPVLAWPLAARTQERTMPVIGFLVAGSPSGVQAPIAEFHRGLYEAGFVEGQNVTVDYRFAEGQLDRMPALAADLVRRQVAVIFASSNSGVLAAKEASATIPIVFSMGGDPVQLGLVASLNRPGGNITGIFQLTTTLEAKRLGLLHELVPKATAIAALVNPNYSAAAETQVREVQEAATRLRVQIIVLNANAESDFDAASGTSPNKVLVRSWSADHRSSTVGVSRLSRLQHVGLSHGVRLPLRSMSATGTELPTSALQRSRRLFGVLLPCRPQRWAAAYPRMLIFTTSSSVTRSSRRS